MCNSSIPQLEIWFHPVDNLHILIILLMFFFTSFHVIFANFPRTIRKTDNKGKQLFVFLSFLFSSFLSEKIENKEYKKVRNHCKICYWDSFNTSIYSAIWFVSGSSSSQLTVIACLPTSQSTVLSYSNLK